MTNDIGFQRDFYLMIFSGHIYQSKYFVCGLRKLENK